MPASAPVAPVPDRRVAALQRLLDAAVALTERLANELDATLDCPMIVDSLQRHGRGWRTLRAQVFEPASLEHAAPEYAFSPSVRRQVRTADHVKRYLAAAGRVIAILGARKACEEAWMSSTIGFSLPFKAGEQQLFAGPPWPSPFVNELDDEHVAAVIGELAPAWADLMGMLPADCGQAASVVRAFRAEHEALIREALAIRRLLTEPQRERIAELVAEDSWLDWFTATQACRDPVFAAAVDALFAE